MVAKQKPQKTRETPTPPLPQHQTSFSVSKLWWGHILRYCVHIWAPQYKREIKILGRVWWRAIRMMDCNMMRMRKGWELGLFTLEKQRLKGISPTCRNTWREDTKMQSGFFSVVCGIRRPEAMGTTWSHREFSLKIRKHFLQWDMTIG